MKATTTLFALAILFASCQKETATQTVETRSVGIPLTECNPNAFCYQKVVYADDTTTTFYGNVTTLMNVVGNWGDQLSFNIYDTNQDGYVNVPDLNNVLGGFGNSNTTDHGDFEVTTVASSAWIAEYPGAYTAFIHVSVTDESGLDMDACPLNTFWTERIYPDSVVREYWHNTPPEPRQLTGSLVRKIDYLKRQE
jgi:hypothetical protein